MPATKPFESLSSADSCQLTVDRFVVAGTEIFSTCGFKGATRQCNLSVAIISCSPISGILSAKVEIVSLLRKQFGFISFAKIVCFIVD